MNKCSRWKVLLEEVTGEEQGRVCGRDRLERGRCRLRMTGPSWMAVGPGAAVALSACPVATALPGSELLQPLLSWPALSWWERRFGSKEGRLPSLCI